MRLRDGRYECALCGAVLDIPADRVPLVAITTSSDKAAKRTITCDGRVVHACPVRTSAD